MMVIYQKFKILLYCSLTQKILQITFTRTLNTFNITDINMMVIYQKFEISLYCSLTQKILQITFTRTLNTFNITDINMMVIYQKFEFLLYCSIINTKNTSDHFYTNFKYISSSLRDFIVLVLNIEV